MLTDIRYALIDALTKINRFIVTPEKPWVSLVDEFVVSIDVREWASQIVKENHQKIDMAIRPRILSKQKDSDNPVDILAMLIGHLQYVQMLMMPTDGPMNKYGAHRIHIGILADKALETVGLSYAQRRELGVPETNVFGPVICLKDIETITTDIYRGTKTKAFSEANR